MSFQVSGDAATTRTNLGLGDAATKTVGTASGNIPLVSSLKTVGGSSIIGSGDIATLPSGGSAGQVLKKDGSNNASWGLGGGLLQTVATSYNGYQSFNSNSFVQSSVTSGVINLVGGTSSKFIVSVHLEGEWDHEKQWSMYRSINGGSYQLCPWGNGAGSPNYGLAHFNLDYDVDNNSTIHQANGSYIDSPSASSSIEYRVYIKCSGGDMWLNRTHGGNPYAAGVCRVVTMEVGV